MTSYTDLAPAFASGRRSPLDLLEEKLAAIAAREPVVKAFVRLTPAEELRAAARASAARWQAGRPLSPLDGATVAVKDIIETRDLATGQGSPLWEGFESRRDGASVQALRAAGLLVIGKATTTEFAATAVFHETTNPHDPRRTPGGSSSGSAAAVAAGMADLALGSQVVGSTLRPASFCGCVGFKPTVGALNRGGSYDYLSQSCTGILAGSLADAWAAARAIADRVGGDPGALPLAGPAEVPAPRLPRRLAVLRGAAWEALGPGARMAFQAAAAALTGAGIELRSSGDWPALAALEAGLAEARALTMAINAWESLWPLGGYGEAERARLSETARGRLAQGEAMTAAEYAAALARRAALRAEQAALMAECDGIVTLSALGAAPVGLASTGDPALVVPASLLGAPAVSLPVLSDAGLPLGLQLVGAAGGDAALFALAGAVGDLLAGLPSGFGALGAGEPADA